MGCTKHLLLEVREDRRQGYGLMLNVRGKRSVSRPTTERELDAFTDRAIEVLFAMGDTCSMRVGLRGPQTIESVGARLSMSQPAATKAFKRAKASLKEQGVDLDAEQGPE